MITSTHKSGFFRMIHIFSRRSTFAKYLFHSIEGKKKDIVQDHNLLKYPIFAPNPYKKPLH
jgi:uncharacterized FlgJ-related protein